MYSLQMSLYAVPRCHGVRYTRDPSSNAYWLCPVGPITYLSICKSRFDSRPHNIAGFEDCWGIAAKFELEDLVERGSSVGRMPDSQSRDPGSNPRCYRFRSLGIFFHFTTPQSTQLYK